MVKTEAGMRTANFLIVSRPSLCNHLLQLREERFQLLRLLLRFPIDEARCEVDSIRDDSFGRVAVLVADLDRVRGRRVPVALIQPRLTSEGVP